MGIGTIGEISAEKLETEEEYCTAEKTHEIRLKHFEMGDNYIILKFMDEEVAVFPE